MTTNLRPSETPLDSRAGRFQSEPFFAETLLLRSVRDHDFDSLGSATTT
jgi:hypothetical protein